jgi:nucleoid DNA-binding protein
MKVVLQDLVRNVAHATNLALPDAQVVVRRLLSTLEEGLISGQRIEIRDFGVFQAKVVSGKKGRDILNKRSIALPDYKKVSFKAGKNIRKLFRELPGAITPKTGRDGQLEFF